MVWTPPASSHATAPWPPPPPGPAPATPGRSSRRPRPRGPSGDGGLHCSHGPSVAQPHDPVAPLLGSVGGAAHHHPGVAHPLGGDEVLVVAGVPDQRPARPIRLAEEVRHRRADEAPFAFGGAHTPDGRPRGLVSDAPRLLV